LAPVIGELVPTLRRFEELKIGDETERSLISMSAATMDRRLKADRAKMMLKGRSHTKPGSLLKDAIAIRTWAQWDDAVPGFVQIDLVGHEGGNAMGDHAYTLTVTDIATGWAENRSVPNKAQKWVFAALLEIRSCFPFPIIGIDSDNAQRVHQLAPAALVRAGEDHFYPFPLGQRQRRRARGAEELGHRADRGRLPPLRHPSRTGAAEPDLGAAVAHDQLLLSAAEAGLQGP